MKERVALEAISRERKKANEEKIDYRLALSRGNEGYYHALRTVSLAGVATQWLAIIAMLIGVIASNAPTNAISEWLYIILFTGIISIPQMIISSYVATFSYTPKGVWVALFTMSGLSILETIWLSKLAALSFVFILWAMLNMRTYNTWFRTTSTLISDELKRKNK